MAIWRLCVVLSWWQPIWSQTKSIQDYSSIRMRILSSLACPSRKYEDTNASCRLWFGTIWVGIAEGNSRQVMNIPDRPIACEVLFEVICWNCITASKKKSVTLSCTWQKKITSCTRACGNCRSHSCENPMPKN